MPDESAQSLNPFRVLLQYRNFRIFWIGQTLSLIGTWMQQVSVAWLALELSDDPFMVGLVVAAETFPILVLSLPGGLVADRNEKLKVVRIAQSLLFFEAMALFVMSVTGHMTIHWLVTIVFFGGTMAAFEIPARQSLIVELVGKTDLPRAIALNSTGFNVARVLGPTLAAIVIAKAGIQWAFFLNALSYFAVLTGLFMMKLPERRRAPRNTPSSLEGLREAIGYVRATPPLPAVLLVAAMYSLLAQPLMTLLPVVARDLGVGAGGYGMFMGTLGFGAVCGALAVAATGGGATPGRTLRTASVVYPLSLLAIAAAAILLGWPSFVGFGLVAAGASMIVNSALTNARLQNVVTDELRGRVMALYVMVFVGASPLGSILAGTAARYIGAAWTIGASAVLLLGFGLWIFRRQPALSAY